MWLLICFWLWLVLIGFVSLLVLQHEEANPRENLQTKCDGTQQSKIPNVSPLPCNSPFQNGNSFEYVYEYDSQQPITKKMMVHIPIFPVIIRHLWLQAKSQHLKTKHLSFINVHPNRD